MSQNILNKENIMIKKLTDKEVIDIYSTYSIRHFPAEERKPLSSIERMLKDGIYTGYGLYEKENNHSLLCYAFFTILPDHSNILLDYFAVIEEYRSHGIGSLFLQHMKDSVTEYNGLLIEIEDPNYASNEKELSIRNKRFAFYNTNGCVFTGILAEVFGVHYRILYFPILSTPPLETLFTDIDAIYQHMVSRNNYNKHVNIFIPEE